MPLIEKNIPWSDFEKESAKPNDPLKTILKLPLPLLRMAILKNLESYRMPEDLVMPIMPQCKHEIKFEHIDLPGKPKPVELRIFRKKIVKNPKTPLFYWIHGGGFLGGDSRINDNLLQWLADETDMLVAAVNYNVSPEVKHPVPLNECRETLSYLIEHYPIDEKQIFISGDSAGGNLSAALTLKLLDEGNICPRGQILLYPACDFNNLNTESYRKKGLEYEGMQKGIKISRSLYLPDRASRKDPYASPIHADFKVPQPDALVLIAQRDGLCDDGIAYGKKLEDAGGNTRIVVYQGALHGFINHMFRSDIADDGAQEILSFIKARMN